MSVKEKERKRGRKRERGREEKEREIGILGEHTCHSRIIWAFGPRCRGNVMVLVKNVNVLSHAIDHISFHASGDIRHQG